MGSPQWRDSLDRMMTTAQLKRLCVKIDLVWPVLSRTAKRLLKSGIVQNAAKLLHSVTGLSGNITGMQYRRSDDSPIRYHGQASVTHSAEISSQSQESGYHRYIQGQATMTGSSGSSVGRALARQARGRRSESCSRLQLFIHTWSVQSGICKFSNPLFHFYYSLYAFCIHQSR